LSAISKSNAKCKPVTKTLHLSTIAILTAILLIFSNYTFADNSTSTAFGGFIGFRVANFKSDHATYSIWYKITNSTVIGTPLDLPAKALIFMINASSDGELTVELPRSIIDSKNGTKDIPYYVAVDDIATLIGRPFHVQANEINDDNLRTVKINFTKTTKEIEIVGTYFVENYSSKMEHPAKTFSPLKQFKSGIPASDVKCGSDFQLILKIEDVSPVCVKPDTAQKLIERGWAKITATKATFDVIQSNTTQRNSTADLGNDTGIITLKNQTYYFVTLNYTHDASFHPMQISFHDVVFTLFPSGFRGGLPIPCNMKGTEQYYWTDANFTDGTHELLRIQVDSPPCTTNPIPSMFSKHTNPQAGLIFYDGKMKLLVSTGVTNSTVSNGQEFKLGPDLLGPLPHQLVFFMKSNSTAKIFVEYKSPFDNTGTMNSWSSVYVRKTDYTPLTTSDVTISADPSSIPLTKDSDTTVLYSITAKGGVKGVYWIFLAQFCRVMPVAIDIDSLTISPFDIPVQMGTMHCPAQLLDAKILGISGGTAEYKIGLPVH
jgi:hypothetical protein